MTIENVIIKDLGGATGFVCNATIEYADWKVDNISYFPVNNYLCHDSVYCKLSGNVKKLCRRAWRKKAKEIGINVEFNF